ncbi:MAG: type 3 dihydrofolate reductase [Buchnera aphidicola (Nurudea yanoniella)]
MKISIIAAISKNFVIGCNGSIPWNLPLDLKWFKKHTLKKSVIMGRKTWNSIKSELPMRQKIVLTHKKNYKFNNVIFANSIHEAIELATNKNEIMIIGGGTLYAQTLPMANKLYLTKINIFVQGDTYFPQYKHMGWETIFSENHITNLENKYNFQFKILKRT